MITGKRGDPAHGADVTIPKRVQSGIPTGGQFAPGAHDESAIELAEHTGGHPTALARQPRMARPRKT